MKAYSIFESHNEEIKNVSQTDDSSIFSINLSLFTQIKNRETELTDGEMNHFLCVLFQFHSNDFCVKIIHPKLDLMCDLLNVNNCSVAVGLNKAVELDG